MAIIGIDLGTTNSLAAVWRDGKSVLIPNSFGEYLTPSAVGLDDDGSVLVGRVARERLVSHPESTAASFKRSMGTDKTFVLSGRSFAPEELSALVLRRLREDAELFLGEPVTEAVVSVPAYFGDAQRCATRRAGQLAGLKVERLVNEPSAAALACRMAGDGDDCKFLVFDFGGGTLDVSVVDCFDNVVSILAVCGDNHLGGADFDREIAHAFCRENGIDPAGLSPVQRAILLAQAEQWKRALSERAQVLAVVQAEGLTGSLALDSRRLIELCAGEFARFAAPVTRALADSGLSAGEIDALVLVGGSCKMPSVARYLRHLTGRAPVPAGSPDTVVALGAGMYAGMKARCGDIRDMLLTDICPFSLGTSILNPADPARGLFSPVIERNSVLPASKTQRFYTVFNNQTDLLVDVYQGESRYCDENRKLGEVPIQVPPAPGGEQSIDVRFTYDINGILEVDVSCAATGARENRVILSRENDMTPEEVRRRLGQLEALKVHPRAQEENRMVVARCERLYQETLGETREGVGRALDYFESVLAGQEARRIALAREKVEAFLDRIEESAAGALPFWPDGEA